VAYPFHPLFCHSLSIPYHSPSMLETVNMLVEIAVKDKAKVFLSSSKHKSMKNIVLDPHILHMRSR
jgi:hypothetical protein